MADGFGEAPRPERVDDVHHDPRSTGDWCGARWYRPVASVTTSVTLRARSQPCRALNPFLSFAKALPSPFT